MNAPSPRTDQPEPELAALYRAAIVVLNWGFRVAATLLVVGLITAAFRDESINSRTDDFVDILSALGDGRASGMVDLAILTIMVTPVIAVLTVAVGFFRVGDRRYGTLSLVVLAVLAISISLSLFR